MPAYSRIRFTLERERLFEIESNHSVACEFEQEITQSCDCNLVRRQFLFFG